MNNQQNQNNRQYEIDKIKQRDGRVILFIVLGVLVCFGLNFLFIFRTIWKLIDDVKNDEDPETSTEYGNYDDYQYDDYYDDEDFYYDEEEDEEENLPKYDTSMFNQISFDDFKDMFEDGDSKVRFVFTGRSNCSFCLRFLPSLQKSVEEYDYELDYLDMISVYSTQASTYSAEDDKTLEEIRAMDYHFTDENTYLGSTPMVYVVQNEKVIDVHVGYTEYEDYASFLEKHGIKKRKDLYLNSF